MASLELLLSFVQYRNRELERQGSLSGKVMPRVKVGCGHRTYEADAENMITEVRGLFKRIIAGEVNVIRSGEIRGVLHDYWLEGEESRLGVVAPRHLAEEAREHFYRGV